MHAPDSFRSVAALAFALAMISRGTAADIEASQAGDTNLIADLARLPFEQLMEQPVTTVSRRQSTIGESPAAVTVITQEDIRRSGATTFPELLRRVPGMNVGRIDTSRWAVSVRGFQDRFANKLLVQMDGRTLYNPIFSGVYWDTVDYALEDIDRIEVIRGPGASVWGANAVNGIINVITKPAEETQGGLLSLGGGSEDRALGTVRYGGRLATNAYYRVYVKAFDRDDSFSSGVSPHDEWWGTRTGVRTDWSPQKQDLVTFQGDYFHSDAQGLEFAPKPFAPYLFLNREHEVADGGDILGRWTHTISDDASWTLQAYWDRAQRNTLGSDLRWDTYDIDLQHQFRWGERQRLVWGVAYRLQDVALGPSDYNGFIIDFPSRHRHPQTVSGFVEDQITLLPDRLTLTLGTKLEHNDFTGVEVQPTGRLLWTPTPRQSAWMSVSRAVVTPYFGVRETQLTQPPVSPAPGVTVFPRIVGNPEYESESVIAYETGYRAQIRTNLSSDIAVFYNQYRDLGVLVPRTATMRGAPAGTLISPAVVENRMDGETYGGELSATWRITDWWKLYGAYSLTKIDLHVDRRLGQALRAVHEAAESRSPQQQVFVQSSWDLPHNVELDVMGRYVDRLSGLTPMVNDYFALDVRVGWRPRKNLMLDIVGQNLLDNHHPEGGSGILAGPRHEIERAVFGKVTFFF